MNANNLISVIMPVRNNGKHLAETLSSISAQIETEWELLLILDRCTDDSQKIAEGYASKDKRIKILHCEGEGIMAGLATGLTYANGVFITRMDGDDIMPPDKLKELKAVLMVSGRGHIVTGQVEYFADGELREGYIYYANWINRVMDEGRVFTEIYKECPIPSPCWMMYRSDLLWIGGFAEGRYPEDYDLIFRAYKWNLTVTPVLKKLHLWRDHEARTSRNDPIYSDRHYFPLKVDYFLDLECTHLDNLYLWGAGPKGKEIAKLLIEHSRPFNWICDNPQKIGQTIYGVTLNSPDSIKPEKAKLIIAISSKPADKEITKQLEELGLQEGKDFFFFCY